MDRVVQFGAGNIGRGFMAQLFFEAGFHTVFVEANEALVTLVNERGSYSLRLLDAYAKQERAIRIANISALSIAQTVEIASAIAGARAAATAVGIENLPHIAPLVAAGIRERKRAGGGAIDIYLCENRYEAPRRLRDDTFGHLDDAHRAWAERNVGFVGTSVARMVPAPHERFTSGDPLLAVADSYDRLPYDGAAARAPRLPIEAMYPVSNFRAEVERKLFTHNLAHAALGYAGYLRGYAYVHETFTDPFLLDLFSASLAETSRALLSRYPEDIDETEHRAVVEDVRIRFSNPMIMDAVQRVARDPIRKLAPGDRLIGSARLCLEQGELPETVALVCGAALCYDYAGDPAAVELQRMIRGKGIDGVLEELCRVEPQSRLGRAIADGYRRMRNL